MRKLRVASWAVGAPMVIGALIAARTIGEGGWVDSMAQTGALLLGIGIVSEFVARKSGRAAFRPGLGLAVVSVLLLGWVNAAVGLVGSEDNPANLMYGAVAGVAILGTLIARLRPAGMARVMIATAIAQAVVGAITGVGRMGAPYTGLIEILTTNGFFITLFVGSAVLFSKAARVGPEPTAA